MRLAKAQKGIFITTIFNTLLFIVLTILSMIVYPGGTQMNPGASRYLFFENFFSDLGRTETFNGTSNIFSRIFFVCALVILGVSLLLYFLFIIRLFDSSKKTRVLSILGSISGIVAAINFILLGIISLDMNDIAHGTFTFIAFIATVIAIIFYTIVVFNDNDYPNVFAWIFIVCSVISISYIIILFGGGTSGPLSNLTLQSITQKLVVYIQILTFTVQAIGAYVILNKRSLEQFSG